MNLLFPFGIPVPALLVFLLPAVLGAQCDHPDYTGLEKFYQATNGAGWDDNTGWLTDCEPCGWKGIECDASGRVVTILLRDNGLTGNLPAEFDGLTQLRHLAIPRNAVGGTLPAALYALSELRDLNLARNEFTGGLSAAVTRLSELEFLRLGRNRFTGTLPANLAACTRLKVLSLEENNFTGRIPEGLGDLPNLEAISLYNNDLNGCFPEDLAGLCERSRVSFGGNPKLTWEGDFSQLCLGSVTGVEQTGAPCDDGDPNTGVDIITEDCLCGGAIDTDGLLDAGPEVDGFTLTEEPEAERFVRRVNPPGLVPHVNPAVSGLVAFPNPLVGGTLNVRLPVSVAGAEVRLLSLNGCEILRAGNVVTAARLNVSALEAGVYLLEAFSDAGRSVMRIVVP